MFPKSKLSLTPARELQKIGQLTFRSVHCFMVQPVISLSNITY